ncbi:uncharacterized protein V1518DRAFT_411920 [Limtongia smithiae]|uniref:uncharacterized protein n=1 Tax=Limtongia smithiae TaxID=1125753 RepID=UPI0034CDF001
MSGEEVLFDRDDVRSIVIRRSMMSNCVVREYLQFACDFPTRIDGVPDCLPIIRYFALCKDLKGRETRVEMTNEKSLRSGELKLPSVNFN